MIRRPKQQVRYEEAGGPRKPEEDEDGSKSGDLKAGKGAPTKAEGEEVEQPTEKNGTLRIRARDRANLEKQVGKKVYVWGRVTSTFTPASNKVKFINIDTEDLNQSFTVVIFNKDWQNFFDSPGIGDPCKYYQNKWIEVSGVVTSYRQPQEKKNISEPKEKTEAKPEPSKLEMIISAPRQIEVLPFREEERNQ